MGCAKFAGNYAGPIVKTEIAMSDKSFLLGVKQIFVIRKRAI
jgi:hypothetical protein